MDVRQTLRSWVFRVWLLAAVCLSFGYLLHRTAIHHQAGLIQSAAALMNEILQFTLLGGTTLVIVLTAGAISSERGIMADSVLSRGISRYQYFLGKWHARLVTILGSFLGVGLFTFAGSLFLLQADVSFLGSLLALGVVAAVLTIVVSCGVTISSLCHSTVLGIAILWMVLYGLGVGLYVLPVGQFDPHRLMRMFPALLHGQYDLEAQAMLIGWCLLLSLVAAFVGLVHFGRCDV
jgi:hypothetical protein